MIRISVHLAVAFFMLAPTLHAGEKISDFQLGFTFTAPDGFVRDPSKVNGKVLYAFQRPASRGQFGTTVAVSRLGGTIGRDKIENRQVAAIDRDATVSTEKWKDFDIAVLRLTHVVEGRPVVLLNAQVPLASEAIQVSVVGDQSREEELRALLKTVLRDLDGRSNWLSDGERTGRGLYVLAVIGGVVMLWLWRKKARPDASHWKDSQPAKSTTADRYAGRGLWIGLAIGAIAGGIVGYIKIGSGLDGLLVGAILGTIPGLTVGLIIGLLAMIVFGRSSNSTAAST